MNTITLDDIKAAHAKVAELIASYEQQPDVPVSILALPEAHIELRHGERYAGAVLDEDGCISHHLVLLPGQVDKVTWQAAREWAADRGATLPNRQEQALLYANLKGCFEAEWYWSCEADADAGAYAWVQYFDYGTQYGIPQSYGGRARAVRRVTP